MLDPYGVLEVSRDADMDEIKKSYRRLSKKYHPDANINNPDKDAAEEKFKQVQQAYDAIVKERESGSSNNWNGGFSGYQQQAESQSSMEMRAAYNYINARCFQEALNVLNRIEQRNAQWYFLHAVASNGMGNTINAMEDARRAVELEPSNMQYQTYYQQLQSGGQWYQSMGQGYGYERPRNNIGNCCCQCCLFNMCCPGCCCVPC